MGSYPVVEREEKFFKILAQTSIGNLQDKAEEAREFEEFMQDAAQVLDRLVPIVQNVIDKFQENLLEFESEGGVRQSFRVPVGENHQSRWVDEVHVKVLARADASVEGLSAALADALR